MNLKDAANLVTMVIAWDAICYIIGSATRDVTEFNTDDTTLVATLVSAEIAICDTIDGAINDKIPDHIHAMADEEDVLFR